RANRLTFRHYPTPYQSLPRITPRLAQQHVADKDRHQRPIITMLGDMLTPTIYQIEGGIIVSLSMGNDVCAIIEFTTN
ncbi:MAG: hypothetical protein VZR53_20405, partial [Prevotella sp.]|nr:hypothetical protein [Prevotella sp.]